jgi:dihydroorotate dehydrogenase electron transfer subunit
MSTPPRSAANREAALVSHEVLDGPFVLLTFAHPEVAREARAGQFVMLKAAGCVEPLLRRPISIMRTDKEHGTFTVFLKVVGPGTRALAALRPGDTALCLGPLGHPFTAPHEGIEALLVAGGYGIAPFVLFCQELQGMGRAHRVFYGGRTRADLQLLHPFAEMGVTLVMATEDGSLGQRGRVTEPLAACLDAERGPFALYACGPDPMLRAVAEIAARAGLPAQVSLDPFMGCGTGICLACVVRVQAPDEAGSRYRCACTEGPVFDAATVLWPGQAESLARSRARGGTA